MRTNIKLLFTSILLAGSVFVWAQQKTITGQVTDSDGFPVADAYVYVEGTDNGVYTDSDGNYTLSVNEGDQVAIQYIGLEAETISVGEASQYDVAMSQGGTIELKATVATALGIERDKKALGYATQQVSGEVISSVPVQNFADALSGEVAGLDLKSSGTLGGSTNIILRGYSSLTGNNQALIVVDGIPVNNATDNASGQGSGGGGYDYGNAAMDIDPNNIANIDVLKGAAATALYGSRGMNGVIMITTKDGSRKKGIGVEVTSSIVVGSVDKETLPKYQTQYGGGYGGDGTSFYSGDINGDGVDEDNIVYTYDDASLGSAFDPSLMVYNWDALYPQLPTYMQRSPWVAGANTPNSIWNNTTTFSNSVSFGGSEENFNYRLSYNNLYTQGSLENSLLKRNTINFSGSYNLSDKLTASTTLSYINNDALGRVGTGYEGRNPMQTFRQWFNLGVDMEAQREAYELTGENITWNAVGLNDNLRPGYTDNYYFNRNKSYQNDERNRYLGSYTLNYEINDWLSVMGRYTFDNYDEVREERIAVGAAGGQGWGDFTGTGEYYVSKATVSENNYDLMLTADKDLSDDVNLNAVFGWNLRQEKWNDFSAFTNSGLKIPGLYSLDNTRSPLTEDNIAQNDINKTVDGLYARASLGYKDTYYLEGSIRTDRSSALPEDNNRYYYPAGSLSVIFSEFFDTDWLRFGKFRINYAEVGNDLPAYNLRNTYLFNPSFGGSFSATNPARFNNPDLKEERLKEFEVGLETSMFKNRVGLDFSFYNRKTEDLLTPVRVSTSSGAYSQWLNSGDIVNKGIEATLRLTPIKMEDGFRWDLVANFAKNESEVTSIYGENEYLELGGAWNVSIGAFLNEPYGVIRGTNYVYHENGQPIVGDNGYYQVSSNNEIIGNMNPDWTGGLRNTFSYKNLTLSFLIDVQEGGDVFSFDAAYGYATGLYDFTAGNNDLGNPVRAPLSEGGGVILPGVNEDGSPNDVRVAVTNFGTNPFGYYNAPEAYHVFDASYVKLRNVTLTYSLPSKWLKSAYIQAMDISFIGRNLWIIHKNMPYSDPEAGLSAGNVQGMQNGAHPLFREIGAKINLKF